jgi:membrane protease subunit HflK
MLKTLINSGLWRNGPWGPWDNGADKGRDKENDNKESGGNDWKDPQAAGQRKKPQFGKAETGFDDFLQKGEDFFKKILSEVLNNKGQNKNNENQKKFGGKTPKSIAGFIVAGIILLWLMLGIYKVDSNENAVVIYFGKFYKVATPGLNYYLPYPFGEVIKRSVTAVNTEEFGFISSSAAIEKRDLNAESLMLTGDENIVDIEFQIQWQIADIYNFVFNIARPNQAIRKAAEGAMREIIARSPIAAALSDGKEKIELETKALLQETLDSYGAGVRIVLVQLRRVDPPSQVIDSFRDVQTAKADKEKEINQAQAYANDVIPRARGAAAQMKEQSEAYAQEVVANAEGEAGRFLLVYDQYSKAKQVTRKRIYLETMEKIYSDMDKIIIGKNAARSGVMPYFPLNDFQQNKK